MLHFPRLYAAACPVYNTFDTIYRSCLQALTYFIFFYKKMPVALLLGICQRN
jgi:hypothetical protein